MSSYRFEIRDVDAQPALAIRATVDRQTISKVLDEAFPEVWAYLQDNDIPAAGPPFTRYLSMSDDATEIEVGFPVAVSDPGSERVVPVELPAGRRAVTLHTGPYETLREAYHALFVWMQEQGLDSAGAPWEVYLTDPGEVDDPAEYQTEINWPVSG